LLVLSASPILLTSVIRLFSRYILPLNPFINRFIFTFVAITRAIAFCFSSLSHLRSSIKFPWPFKKLSSDFPNTVCACCFAGGVIVGVVVGVVAAGESDIVVLMAVVTSLSSVAEANVWSSRLRLEQYIHNKFTNPNRNAKKSTAKAMQM